MACVRRFKTYHVDTQQSLAVLFVLNYKRLVERLTIKTAYSTQEPTCRALSLYAKCKTTFMNYSGVCKLGEKY